LLDTCTVRGATVMVVGIS